MNVSYGINYCEHIYICLQAQLSRHPVLVSTLNNIRISLMNSDEKTTKCYTAVQFCSTEIILWHVHNIRKRVIFYKVVSHLRKMSKSAECDSHWWDKGGFIYWPMLSFHSEQMWWEFLRNILLQWVSSYKLIDCSDGFLNINKSPFLPVVGWLGMCTVWKGLNVLHWVAIHVFFPCID